MSEHATGTKGALAGVQLTLFGFFLAWAFREQFFFVGSLFVLAGTVVVLFNVFYR